METEYRQFISVKNIFRSKSPRLARWIPGFLLGLVARMVKEPQINDAMSRIGHLEGIDFCQGVIKELEINLKTIGLENIPKTGGIILVSNHPLGGPDGIALLLAVSRQRPDMVFLVNDILMNLKNLECLFVPVNKHGANSRQASARIEEAYASDKAVLIFPAGLVSRKHKNGISDVTWNKSFVSRAVKYSKDVLPVHIDGQNSGLFYNLAHWRKKLGIKTNIEMFLLPRELFRQRGKTITITFGKPVSHTHFDNSASERHWASEMRKTVYTLAKNRR